MGKLIISLVITTIFLGSCSTSKKQETVSLNESLVSINALQHNGSYIGDILDKDNRKNASRITLSSDTNNYTLDTPKGKYSGTFSWNNQTGNIIELNGLGEKYPNKFLVTSNAIIQMMNGSTLQDINGNNQFVLAMQ